MVTKATAKKVMFLCELSYFMSYITRLGYAAGLVEITRSLGLSASALSLGCTGLFITYGAGQLLSGWLGDRIIPRKMMLIGLLGASACNLLLPLCPNAAAMVAVWCVNGLFQAMLWPPMVRLLSDTLDAEGYTRGVKNASTAAYIATIAVYALMSLFSRAHFWQGYFYFAGIAGAATALFFNKTAKTLSGGASAARKEAAPPRKKIGPLVLASGLPVIMFAIVMQGMLRDGVTTWMPSLIADTANMGASASILSAAILPLFSVVCINFAAWLQKKFPNDCVSSLLLFAVCAACSLVMLPLLGSAAAAIACMAVITGCAHAINFLLVCHVPSYFAPHGCVSSVSGLINSCTYIGSAISTYGIALLSDQFGWFVTVAVWAAISVLGAAACIAVKKRWAKFIG